MKTGKINKKTGKEIKIMKSVQEKCNLTFITNFISEKLPDIIFHRNHLKHYKNFHSDIYSFYDSCISIDADFAENLSVPVKFEPQSMHWSRQQVTIHSGSLKINGEKSYYPYFLDDRLLDSTFTDIAIKEMLMSTDVQESDAMIIENDNRTTQYKSASDFFKLQQLSDVFCKPIIRVWSVAGHGKGEVDHVGGIAKVTIRPDIASGMFFTDAEDMVCHLSSNYAERQDLKT